MVSEGMVLAGRYEIISRIGTGGMSDVYKAQDTKLSRFVAIKVLKQEYAENDNFVTKFHAEAQAAAGLIHSNIVGVYDVGEDLDLQYIVMELVEGITLKHYIEKKLRLSVKESISIAIQMAQGLECAHKAGIIHRDVKPQNVIISKDGKVKVTDFGIAKAATSETITSNVMGSVHYTSPEQARGGYSDEKSDIYSLGIVIFEMVTGRVPFDGDTTVTIAIQHIQEVMPSPREFVNDIPISLEQIIFKCTEKNSDRRYSSMAEVIKDLKQSLLTPDENFVKRIGSGGVGGSTKMVTEEDIRSIKSRTGTIDVDESLISAYNRNKEQEIEEREAAERQKALEIQQRRANREARLRAEEERLDKLKSDSEAGEERRRRPRSSDRDGDEALDERRERSDRPRRPRPRMEDQEDFEEEELRRQRKEAARRRREQERANEERRRRSAASNRQRVRRYADDDDDMDEGMSMIMRIIALVIGVIILILIIFIARKVLQVKSDTVSENTIVSQNSTLPDVAGKTFDEAKKELEKAGFVVQSRQEGSDSVPKGQIIGTDPAAGSQLPEGYTVTLVISSGAGTIEVPDLSNATAAEARVSLENLGLVVSITEGSSATVPSGSVISQTPAAGEMVPPGATVTVVVNNGETVTSNEIPEGEIAVPNIIGLTEAQAKTALTATGLGVGKVEQKNSDTVIAGVVLSQSVDPDTLVAADTTVDFVLSLGPEQTAQVPAAYTTSVHAPEGYVPGTAAKITMTGNTTGTVYGQKDVTEFPVTIQIASSDVNSADTAGIFTIDYTARTTVTDDAGAVIQQDAQRSDQSQSISFAGE